MPSRIIFALLMCISACEYVNGGQVHGGDVGGGYAGQGNGLGWGNKDYYAVPNYKYSYGVNDHHNGDVKQASESRDGDKVQGEYGLLEPDGSWRSVKYYADHSGFHANVERSPSKNGYGNGWTQG